MALDISSIQNSGPLPHEGARMPPPHEAAAQAAPPVMPSDLEAAIMNLERVSDAFNRRLSFTLNEKLGQVVVKVIDADTDKVIKEIPPAEIQEVHERIREVIGILFDERA